MDSKCITLRQVPWVRASEGRANSEWDLIFDCRGPLHSVLSLKETMELSTISHNVVVELFAHEIAS